MKTRLLDGGRLSAAGHPQRALRDTVSGCRLSAVLGYLLIAAAAPSAAIAGEVLDRINATGVLVVAADPEWPPTSYQRPDGAFEGFDVDVVTEIAARMGVRVEFYLPYSFEAILAGDWNGQWDIAMSVSPTSERAERIAFATVYAYGMSALVVHQDNNVIDNPADASGKRIGVVLGTEYEKVLTREPFDLLGAPPIRYIIDDPIIVRFESTGDMYDALAKGDGVELDGILDDLTAHIHAIEEGAPIRIVGSPLSYTPSGIAIEQGDAELAELLSGIVDTMHADGTLSAISLKWYEYDFTKPP
jgi:polar amino acid transport system substrate-binding protein